MKENKIKNTRAAKLGSISLIGAAVVLAVVIILNVAVNVLPSRFTKYSVSKNGVYDISDATKKLMSGVKDSIAIYVVSETDSVDKVTLEYSKRIADLNPNFICEQVDPVLKPGFIGTYTSETLSSTDTNIIVVNGSNGRSKVIPQSDIYYRQYSDYEVYYYYMMYGQQIDNPMYFDLENCLATAVDYVTAEKLPVVYYTEGHGETVIDATVTKLIEGENIKLSALSTLTSEKIPEDADTVIIYAPVMDIVEKEAGMLSDYVDGGGKVVLITGVNSGLTFYDLPNLYAFAEKYGLIYSKALVLEGSQSYYVQYPYYIVAQMGESVFADSVPSNSYVIMPFSHEIKLADDPGDLVITELFTTSLMGYVKEGKALTENFDYKKESGDREGKIVTGAMSENGSGALVWFSSAYILDGSTAGYYSNITYMMSVITSLAGKETKVYASANALQIEALQVTEASANAWGTVIIGVIPAALIIAGAVAWHRRKVR